jgi:hypothetical protein
MDRDTMAPPSERNPDMKQLTSLAVAVAAVALLVLLFAAPVLTVAAAVQ